MPFRLKPLLFGALLGAAGLALAARNTAPTPLPAKAPSAVAAMPSANAAPSPAMLTQMVNIDSASKQALCQLPGVDAKLAALIIAGRPYHSKADLVSHKVISMAVYQGIRTQIYAGGKPVAKK